MIIQANETTLFVRDEGRTDGPPVVFVHGFPFSHEMWAPQVGALSDKYRVISYDVRGLGQSPAGDGQYTLEFFVDDLIGLLDGLKIEKAVVCGLSMGGYIALRAIEKYPARFSAAVLADTRSEADSNEAKIKRAAALKTVKREGAKVFAEGFLKAVFAPESFTRAPQAVQKIRSIIEATPPAGICGAILALASRTDTTANLNKVAVPALILVGEHDTLTPPSAAEAMAALIPNSELHVIPHAAHMSNLENTPEFNLRLRTFLDARA